MIPDDDFGGVDIVEREPDALPGKVLQFPRMRANAKLAETWAKELERSNERLGKRYKFPSPLEAAADLARQRQMPTLPWPASWSELSKRAKLYVGECVGVIGPTGGGKTSFALQTGIAASAEGIPVLWNPLELDAPQVDLRLVANMTALHTARIREDWSDQAIANALAAVDDLWRFIPRERSVEAQFESYRVAVALAKEIYRRPPLLVCDYIGKLARGTRDPRLATADAAELFRELAVDLECYVMILAQPSRSNNATLTGKNDLESATDAIGVAGESSEIEHACAVQLGLNVFKVDDADDLDAHVLVTKARGTGREGRQGYRFHKPGGVWKELGYLPPTPNDIAKKTATEKKNKSRIDPPTKDTSRNELQLERADDANAERRRRVADALRRAGMIGLTLGELRRVPGTGAGMALQQSLQELERAGDVEKLIGAGKWRTIFR